jgi:uncharacterized membrane protein YfhO
VFDAGTVYIYENPNVLPRAFTIDVDVVQENEARSLSSDVLSKLEPATITMYRNNEVLLKGTANKPSLLVLTDNWHTNWKAFVNGAQSDIIRVQGTFRGVPVPAGPYEVRFHYQPRSLNLAILTSGIILFLLCYLAIDYKRVDRFLTARLHTPNFES